MCVMPLCAQSIEMLSNEAFWSYKSRVCMEVSKSPVFLSSSWSCYQLFGLKEKNDLKSYWMGFGIPTIYRK